MRVGDSAVRKNEDIRISKDLDEEMTIARLDRDADEISSILADELVSSGVDIEKELAEVNSVRTSSAASLSAPNPDVSPLSQVDGSRHGSIEHTVVKTLTSDQISPSVHSFNGGFEANLPENVETKSTIGDWPHAFKNVSLNFTGELEEGKELLKFEPDLMPLDDCGATVTNMNEFVGLVKDLHFVLSKVALCRDLLKYSPGISEDQELGGVIGFLEASRDRLQNVLRVSEHGMISPALTSFAKFVLGAIARALDAEREGLRDFVI